MQKLRFQVALMTALLTSACTHSTLNHAAEANVDEPEQQVATVYSGSMNISAFVYRDVNRNGVYDLEDRPYCGLEVLLYRPHDDPVEKYANISGFTNFKMSLNNPKYPIRVPGNYRIEAQPAENWLVTSGNAEQELEISELLGSPGGLIAQQTLEPIGMAPILFIAGALDDELSAYPFFAVSEDGQRSRIAVNTNGEYRFSVEPGLWTLELEASHLATTRRAVQLTDYPCRLSRWTLSGEYMDAMEGDPIGFDDLTTSDTLYEIPNGYGGLHWRNWISTHQKLYSGCGYVNNTTSGEYLLYNSSGHPASLYAEKPFTLVGMNVGVAWPRGEKGYINVEAYRKGQLVYHDRIKVATDGPVYFAAGYREITSVEFSTEFYWQVVIDDMRVK